MEEKQEKIFKLDFKTFSKSPFAYLFFVLILGLIYLGKTLLTAKDTEIMEQRRQILDCETERKNDKRLLQDIVFQEKLNKELTNGR